MMISDCHRSGKEHVFVDFEQLPRGYNDLFSLMDFVQLGSLDLTPNPMTEGGMLVQLYIDFYCQKDCHIKGHRALLKQQ